MLENGVTASQLPHPPSRCHIKRISHNPIQVRGGLKPRRIHRREGVGGKYVRHADIDRRLHELTAGQSYVWGDNLNKVQGTSITVRDKNTPPDPENPGNI